MKKSSVLLSALSMLAGTAAFGGWIQTAAGTYDYNDPANWEGGVLDGVFPSTLVLKGAQTIQFADDTALTNGLTLNYDGKFAITFVSSATNELGEARSATVTLGGDITMNTKVNDGAVVVNFGSQTSGKEVVLDLGGAARTITVAQGRTTLKILNKVTNGGLVLENVGTVLFNDSSNDYALGTTIRGTGPVNVMQNTLGTGTITVENASFITSGNRTFTNNNPIVLNGRLYFNGSNGDLDLGAGPITINEPVNVESSKRTLTLGGQIAKESPCGIDAIAKSGDGSLTTKADCVTDSDVTLAATQGNWNFEGKLVTTGRVAFTGGGQYGTSYIYMKSTENAFSGEVTLAGDLNFAMVQFATAGSLPEDVTFKILDKGALMSSSAYSCASFIEKNLISQESIGSLCLGVAENDTIDLSSYPMMGFGAAVNLTYAGSVAPNNGVYRFAGPATLTLSAANAVTGESDVEISGSGEVKFSNLNDLSGTLTVNPGGKVCVMNADGSFPNAKFVINGGTLNMTSAAACDILRVKDVTLRAGSLYFEGNKNSFVKHRIGSLTLETMPGLGGTPQLTWSTKDSKQTTLEIGKIVRPQFAMLNVSGGSPGLTACESGWNVLVGEGVENTTEGTIGTTTAPFVPWIRNGSTNLVYNDPEKGFRFHTTDERQLYDKNYEAEGPVTSGENMLIAVSGTVMFTGSSATVGTFCFGSKENQYLKMAEGGILKVTSGVVGCTYNKVNPSVTIDLNGKHGYILGVSNRAPKLYGSVGGTTEGLTIANESSARGNYIEIAAAGTYSGDVYLNGAIWNQSATFLPGGSDRPGNVYLEGWWRCGNASTTINGLFGSGLMEMNNGYNQTITMGGDGHPGDFDGEIRRSNGTLTLKKIGAGRQRFGGACGHNGATTVEAGVLQNDGSFTASATIVKSGATLAGSGAFEKLVTLEDGAKLEAGSVKTEDQVMDLNGGLTLKGDATLGLVVKDKLTLGGVKLGGALTIPADKVVTVNVLADEGVSLKSGSYVVCEATAPLPLANFKRGTKCGRLSLSEDHTQLLMTASAGIMVIIK